MKTLIASLVTFVVVLVGGATVAQAQAPPHKAIGITGETYWPSEFNEALRVANRFGLPVHNGCVSGDLCIRMEHYSAKDGFLGMSHFNTDRTIRLNNHYDRGHLYRIHLLLHEIGHHAGLDHAAACDSSMTRTVPACGNYYFGYSPAEQAELRRIWG